MSLLSSATFYKNGKEIYKKITNCGCFMTNNTIREAIKNTLIIEEISDDEWDSVVAYDKEFTKDEILNNKMSEVKNNEEKNLFGLR